jgi:hypothetical protein
MATAANELILIEPDQPALALEIPADQSFDDWVLMGRKLCASSQVINWYIGDWWAAGQHKYGARAKAAAEGIFGKEFQTLANIASVCRSFETSRRREVLSFGHHEAVAALPPEEADPILAKAEKENLSVKELRREVIRHRITKGDFTPNERDDPEYEQAQAIARVWNRAGYPARRTILDLLEETGAITIVRDDAEREELDP